MKFLIVAVSVIAVVSAATPEQGAEIYRNDYNLNAEGSFQSAYETSNGIIAQADGVLKQFDKDAFAVVQTGSFKYAGPDGEDVVISYVADENGFHPQGSHLPTPPPTQAIPEAIARSLEWIAAHPYEEKKF